MERVSGNASAVYLQIIRDQNQRAQPVFDLVKELYIATQTRPHTDEFRPGITIKDMALVMSGALGVFAQHFGAQPARAAQVKSRTKKAGAQAAQKEQSLADQATVARLRSRSAQGSIPSITDGE